jgi:hypothetical protein
MRTIIKTVIIIVISGFLGICAHSLMTKINQQQNQEAIIRVIKIANESNSGYVVSQDGDTIMVKMKNK